MNLASLLGKFFTIFNPITLGNSRLTIYAQALKNIGTDASPNDVAPDEYGCSESVCDIVIGALGWMSGISFTVSTNLLYKQLEASKSWIRVDQPLEGDIIISPTGYGNGKLPNGHTGIVGQIDNNVLDKSVIMSNDSATGKFLQNYTLKTWKARYQQIGGYPVAFYRKL